MALTRMKKELEGRLPEEFLQEAYSTSVKSKTNRKIHYQLTHYGNNALDRTVEPSFARVPPYGSVNSPLIIANTFPYAEDVRSGVPFSDSYGMIMLAYLRALGIDRENVFMSTVFKDLSYTKMDLTALQDALYEQVAHCLWVEIYMVKPKAVLLMGEQMIRAFREMAGFTEPKSMEQLRLAPESMDIDKEGTHVTFFYTYDPAHLVHCSYERYGPLKDCIWTDLSTATAFAGLSKPQGL